MSLGLLKGRSPPGSVVSQPGSVLQRITVIDSPQCRGARKTIVLKMRTSMAGHVTPNLRRIGEYEFHIGQLVRFPADEAKRLIAKSFAVAVDEAG